MTCLAPAVVISCCFWLPAVLTNRNFIGCWTAVAPEEAIAVAGAGWVPEIETVGLVYSWIGELKLTFGMLGVWGLSRKLVGTREILPAVLFVVLVGVADTMAMFCALEAEITFGLETIVEMLMPGLPA